MIIIGIDPGLNTSGYGVLRYERNKLSYLAAGTIKTAKSCTFSEKLEVLYTNCTSILEDYHPDVFAIEETFSNINPRSSLKLGHARGVLMLAGQMAGLPVYEYPATIVKKALTGTGSATKEQVKYMVMSLLKIKALPGTYDVSDALAIALTHYNQLHYQILKS